MNIWAFPSIYPYDYPKYKWKGIFAHRQYKGLIENGASLQVIQPVLWHPPSIFCRYHPEWQLQQQLNYPFKRIHEGIVVHHPRVTNYKPSRIFRQPLAERYTKAIVDFFRKNKIELAQNDVFYAQWLPDAYLVQKAAKQLGVRSAIAVIGDDVLILPDQQPDYMSLFENVIEHADIRITVADYLGKEANRRLNKDYKWHTIRRGTDYDFFAPVNAAQKKKLREGYDIPENKTAILCIGAAIVGKGWRDLFQALSKVRQQFEDFVLVGVYGGTSELNLVQEAALSGLSGNFIAVGEVSPTDMNKLYQMADVFCLPSHSEGIANVVVEAMASGLPVITTNVSGHPELIKTMETGILVPPQSPDKLAEAMLAVLTDKELQTKLGVNARKFIVETWGNLKHNAKKLYNIFQSFDKSID